MIVSLVLLNYLLVAFNVYFWVRDRSAPSAAAAVFCFGTAQLLTALLVAERLQ